VRNLAIKKYHEIEKFSKPRSNIPMSDLEALVEGTLLATRNSYEERKVPLLANLIAKAPFTNTPIENLNHTLVEAERLTYRQLCILKVIDKNQWKGELNLSDVPFQDEEHKQFNEYAEGVYQDINLLIVNGIVGMMSENGKYAMMASGTGLIVPATLRTLYPGRLLVNGLELSGISDTEVSTLIEILRKSSK
ncbi:MAG: hypothetical protein V1487_02710, partial [bacterium]